ncbi:hypothetical protein M0D46_16510 [Xanthomonas prunicola]|uniref:hypothetical protein n=1 Tax=Xanthomonas prunicola TaxID=2053930 RepID=UPI0021B29851|nr:hypothetical protein [Xanthomonas prunicola]UXA68664.1 hypothetical protein M0D46_16510 [Xanthomonas prunicola]
MFFLTLGFLMLVACRQDATYAKENEGIKEERRDMQKDSSESSPQQRKSEGVVRVTSLYQVVSLLVANDGASWSSFDSTPGVQWREPSPQPNPDSSDPENSKSRSGTLVLDGFGMVEVPDGNQGVDAGVKKVNEGESGLTLTGDAQNVHSIAVKKFYVSPEYGDVMKRQLPDTASVRLVAGDCAQDMGDGPDTQTKFYVVDLEGRQLFLEAYVDDGEGSRGPGYTTFLFTKEKPDKRIEELQCKAR